MITSVVFISLFGVYYPMNNKSTPAAIQPQQAPEPAASPSSKSSPVDGAPAVPGSKKQLAPNYTTILVPNVANPFDKIDRVYFINLDDRVDRRYQLEQEFKRMNIDPKKIQRVPGVLAKIGAMGCSQAHLNVLLDCKKNGYRNCLVVEDDLTFKGTRQHTHGQLHRLWSLGIKWDVVMFGSHTIEYEKTDFSFLLRVFRGQTTSGYLVNGHYLDTLIENFQTGLAKLQAVGTHFTEFCIDVYWRTLQKKDLWFTFHPVLAYQRDSYSDIEKRMVSYPDKFVVVQDISKHTFFICVKTCYPRWRQNQEQQKALDEIVKRSDGKIQYLFYYGDPTISTPYQYDWSTRTLIVQSKDDYLNLCHKVGILFSFLHNACLMEASFQNIEGFFFTDDDITLYPEQFFDFLLQNKQYDYWGVVFVNPDPTSEHLICKCQNSMDVMNQFRGEYQMLTKTPIAVPQGLAFCRGGCFFLTTRFVHVLSQMEEHFPPFPSSEQLKLHLNADGVLENLHVFDDMEVGIIMNSLGKPPVADLNVSQIVQLF